MLSAKSFNLEVPKKEFGTSLMNYPIHWRVLHIIIHLSLIFVVVFKMDFMPQSLCKSIASVDANGDANGAQSGPGFQELPTVTH